MKSQHKIFLEKQDTVEAAVSNILGADTPGVVLNIPRGAVIASSVKNFEMLVREAHTAGKELEIESVDDHVLELALRVGIPASNPILRTRERSVSDIVMRPRVGRSASASVSSGEMKPPPAPQNLDSEIATPFPPAPIDSTWNKPAPVKKEKAPKRTKKIIPEPEAEPPAPPVIAAMPVPKRNIPPPIFSRVKAAVPSSTQSFRWVRIFGVLVVLGVLGWWVGWRVLPHATVNILLKETSVPFTLAADIRQDITTSSVSASGRLRVPGELFVSKRNLTMQFPTEGRERVEVKARGTLIVQNAFSSEAQALVATTRFESPDGKIFHLDARTTIPGASIKDGKIVPSTIEVAVTADGAGPEYNVGASAGWRIPGFKGSPKYEGFTARAASGMTGGFIGERPVPTADEISKAESTVQAALRRALDAQILVATGDRFTLLDGASQFTITKRDVQTDEKSPGEFSLYLEAEMREFVFLESMLTDAIVAAAQQSSPGAPDGIRELSKTYGAIRVDLSAGSLSVPLTGKVILVEPLNADDLRTSFLGKDEAALRAAVSALPGVERAQVSLKPFWVGRVPANPAKVTVTLD